jgi:hypothetical protein
MREDPAASPDPLAPAYRRALELEAAGASPHDLAAQLGVPPEAVASLLRIAHLKAAGVGARGDRGDRTTVSVDEPPADGDEVASAGNP